MWNDGKPSYLLKILSEHPQKAHCSAFGHTDVEGIRMSDTPTI
jgi:hypothetical protein